MLTKLLRLHGRRKSKVPFFEVWELTYLATTSLSIVLIFLIVMNRWTFFAQSVSYYILHSLICNAYNRLVVTPQRVLHLFPYLCLIIMCLHLDFLSLDFRLRFMLCSANFTPLLNPSCTRHNLKYHLWTAKSALKCITTQWSFFCWNPTFCIFTFQ